MTKKLPAALLFGLVLIFSTNSIWAAAKESGVILEGVYGFTNVDPADLNKARANFEYESVTAATTKFDKLTGLAFGAGYKFNTGFQLVLRRESRSQKLSPLNVPAGPYTVIESFTYERYNLIFDFPFDISEDYAFSLRAGISKATKYELSQKINSLDLVWAAEPMGYSYGATFIYNIADFFALFADVTFETVKSRLKTEKAYPTLNINGSPIQSGQTYRDVNTGKAAEVDMSGTHFGLGLRLTF